MKKNLLALAVAGAFVAPVAMADTGNVTVYGIADVSVDNVKNGDIVGGASGVTNNKISSNSSRLGFKGSEDLGGGLKAIWQIEQAITIDNSLVPAANAFGTRNTFAGLAGDSWGSLTFGRNDTPYKSATRGFDVFMDHIADNRSLMGTGSTGFDVRLSDTVRYDSPDLSGFKVAASYSTASESNTTSGTDVKGRAESLAGTYATGPFTAALAYQKNVFGSTSNTNVGPGVTFGTCAGAGALCDEKAWKIGGGYKMDQFGINAVYEKTSDNLGNAAGGMGHKAYYVSGVFNATANDAIKLAYTKARDLRDGNLANTGAKQWSIGVDHSLSKRTTAYAMYTKLDNDSAASYFLNGVATGATGGTTARLGADPSAFSLGLKHTF